MQAEIFFFLGLKILVFQLECNQHIGQEIFAFYLRISPKAPLIRLNRATFVVDFRCKAMEQIKSRYDVESYRKDFPLLHTEMNGKPLVYLDNAATTQKPQVVIDSLIEAYTTCNANVHRGVYRLSREATERHEAARATVAKFIGADSREILFTRGTTESLNLVASTYGMEFLQPGDEIIVSTMEHHSNIVPWQQVALRCGCTLRVIPIHDDGSLDQEAYRSLLTERTRLVSIAHVSNVLGTINPIREMIAEAHAVGAVVVIDGAQGAAHEVVDVKELDCDFYAFSGHKLYAPTGIGVLYGKAELLEKMPPYQFGGEMIEKVTFEQTTFNTIPYKFEAGTPNFVGSVALAKAIEYVQAIGLEAIGAHEKHLLSMAVDEVASLKGVRLIGTAPNKEAVLTFVVDGVHPYDLVLLMDQQGIALRSGHHCAEPLLDRFGITSTLRASFALYNTEADVHVFVAALRRALSFF